MATKKPAKGKWTSETLGEEEITDKMMWRAQRSVAPDGKVFYGVRKVIKKSDGTELMGKDGMSFMVDDENIRQQRDQIMKVINCFQVLNSQLGQAVVKTKAKKVTDKMKYYIVDEAGYQAGDDVNFIVERTYNKDTKKYKTKTTTLVENAMEFTSKTVAETWLSTNQQKGLPDKWVVAAHEES